VFVVLADENGISLCWFCTLMLKFAKN